MGGLTHGGSDWVVACIPEEEPMATKIEDGGSLSEGRWASWWEETLRGSQECGLLVEFYEEQPSACRTVWHPPTAAGYVQE